MLSVVVFGPFFFLDSTLVATFLVAATLVLEAAPDVLEAACVVAANFVLAAPCFLVAWDLDLAEVCALVEVWVAIVWVIGGWMQVVGVEVFDWKYYGLVQVVAWQYW